MCLVSLLMFWLQFPSSRTRHAMLDRLLVLWDGFSSLGRRHRDLERFALRFVTVAALTMTAFTGICVFRFALDGRATSGRIFDAQSAWPPPSPTTAPPRTPATPRPKPATRSSASVRPRQGADLAVVWLRGYLSRSMRTDEQWVSALRDLTAPELLQTLQAEGPKVVGLDRLGPWRVARIEPFTAVEQPVDTESRTVLSYAAVVTDGRTEVEKPFQLYCYRAADGRWLVTSIDQPYSSEG